MVQYIAKNDTHKKWLHIINKVKQGSKKIRKVQGVEVSDARFTLIYSSIKHAYPIFEILEDGKFLLQLFYTKEYKYHKEAVGKPASTQKMIIEFLKQITKKDFVIETYFFEEGQEKCIYDEMEKIGEQVEVKTTTFPQDDILVKAAQDLIAQEREAAYQKKQEEKRLKQEAIKKAKEERERQKQLKQEALEKARLEAEERERREKEEFIKKQQSKGSGVKALIDPFGGGFIGPDNDGLPF